MTIIYLTFFKRIALILGLAFICGFFLAFSWPDSAFPPSATQETLPIILLDPGHGGYDGGTGENQGVLEKNIVLEFTFLLKAELEKYNFPVYMTRTTDNDLSKTIPWRGGRQRTDLYARVNLARQYNAAILLSIHVNSSKDPGEKGAIPFYKKNSPESKRLASHILHATKAVQPYNKHKILPGNYYILNASPIPAVLLELAFITNSEELNLLQDKTFLSKMAEQVAKGVHHYHVTKDVPVFLRWLFGGSVSIINSLTTY